MPCSARALGPRGAYRLAPLVRGFEYDGHLDVLQLQTDEIWVEVQTIATIQLAKQVLIDNGRELSTNNDLDSEARSRGFS